MPTGRIDSSGEVTVTWNIQDDCLPAPRGVWLPCECGALVDVSRGTVAVECAACASARASNVEHLNDEDCRLDTRGVCVVCRVYHGDPCLECGGRGYHRAPCSEIEVHQSQAETRG